MLTRTATVASSVGLHARPASVIAAAAGEYDLDITLTLGDEDAVDAASVLEIMTMGAACGDVVVVSVDGDGPEAEAALAALVTLIETNLDAE